MERLQKTYSDVIIKYIVTHSSKNNQMVTGLTFVKWWTPIYRFKNFIYFNFLLHNCITHFMRQWSNVMYPTAVNTICMSHHLRQMINFYVFHGCKRDCLCGLVVGVSGYRYRGLGFDSRRYQIFWVAVGLEWGALSLVSLMRSIEELLE